MTDKLSIVVIGRNEGARLVRCLNSVKSSDLPATPTEFIYVDSDSSDASVENARNLGFRAIELTGKCSAARARNAGWRAASGDWILFLDGDTVLHPGFLGKALSAAQADHVAAVWGHRRELRPTANFYHRVLDLDWVYPPGPSEFCGGDVLMRRHALEMVGGFEPSLIAGEEPELCSRLRGAGYTILHIDAPMTGHDLSITRFSQYWKHAVRGGYAYALLAQRTARNSVPMWTSETRRNANRALAVLTVFVLLPLAAALARNIWLFSVPAFIGGALVLRTALRCRWKGGSPLTLACYGFHSHIQQIPIFAGQVAFWFDQFRARNRELIEYK